MNLDEETRKHLLLGGPDNGNWFVADSVVFYNDNDICYSMIKVILEQGEDGFEAVPTSVEIYLGKHYDSYINNNTHQIIHTFENSTVTTPIQYSGELNEQQSRFRIIPCGEDHKVRKVASDHFTGKTVIPSRSKQQVFLQRGLNENIQEYLKNAKGRKKSVSKKNKRTNKNKNKKTKTKSKRRKQ